MNPQLEKLEESKAQDSTSSGTCSINNNDDKYDQHNQPRRSTKIHLPIILGGIEVSYLHCSEEGCSQ